MAVGPSRRQVLRGAGTSLGAAALAPVFARTAGAAQTAAPAPAGAAAGRSVDLDQNWRFVLVNPDGVTDPTGAYANAPDPGFDDSGWRIVDVPHDWSIELTPVDSSSTYSGTGFLQGGLGWYRKTFTLPPSISGKRISIEFDGVYMNSFVYLNGQLLGNHPYAYTGFSFDITALAHTDGVTPNVVAVQAMNQNPSSRWYSGSGIYRDVRLVVTDPVHVARLGTFVTTPDLQTTIGSGYANVHVQTDIANDGATGASVDVETTVRNAGGAVVARGTSSVSVAAGQTQVATVDMRVSNPALWSVDSPVLYRLQTDVVVGGAVVDTTTTEFGIRYFVFDPNEGFSLNGKHMKLQGVDLHATQGPLGAVVNPDTLARQMEIMKSMGVNALRTAHNPPAQGLVQVCDRLGILMMVEAFDCWHTGKLPFDYHLYFDAWSDSDIKEMVNESKNSPAVVLWSIGNETPDTGRSGGPAIAQKLIADIKSIDTTRPVVMGSDRYRSVPRPGSSPDQIVRMLDGLGVNYNTATSMDALHAAYPNTFFFCSETSSETSTRGIYQDPQLLNTGENYTPGKRATSSYDNNLASWTMSGEYELKKDRDRLFWIGGFLWSGQDYIGEPTPYNVFPVKASFFGAVDTAGFQKDAYHLFKSQWGAEPMVHIVPMDWTSHAPGEHVAVWVYANVEEVELFLNGTSLGVRTFDHKTTTFGQAYLETTEPTGDDKNYPSGSYTSPNGSTGKLHLSWDVPFAPGRLTAVATQSGRVVAQDTVQTAGPARAITLRPDKRVLAADSKSLAFVTVQVVDSRGIPVPGVSGPIQLRVTGPGRLAGVDNGRQENAESYQASSVTAFNGNALAIVESSRRPGPVTLTAVSPGLQAAAITLRSVAGEQAAGPAAPEAPGTMAAAAAGAASAADASTPAADASYSGAPNTLPAAMLDGDLTTGWSNYYLKSATANLNAVSVSRASDWVSVAWPKPQAFSTVTAYFSTSATLTLPASISVMYWTGRDFVPVRNLRIVWATASNQPTTLTFDPVRTAAVRLDMTSPTPGTSSGFLRIAELQVT
jgi:beta-galactosidase